MKTLEFIGQIFCMVAIIAMVAVAYWTLFMTGAGKGIFDKEIGGIRFKHVFCFILLICASGIFGGTLLTTLGAYLDLWPKYREVRMLRDSAGFHLYERVLWTLAIASVILPLITGRIFRHKEA